MPDRLEEIERRLKRLEGAIFPETLPTPKLPWVNLQPSPAIGVGESRCAVCGLDWSGAMSYICPNSRCPVQPQVTS